MKKQIILAAVALMAPFGAQAGSAQAAMGNMASAKNAVAAETLTKVSRRHGRGHRHRGHRRHRWHRRHHFRPYYVGLGCGFYWGKWNTPESTTGGSATTPASTTTDQRQGSLASPS
jgi:hypothetical protein